MGHHIKFSRGADEREGEAVIRALPWQFRSLCAERRVQTDRTTD